MDEQWDICLTGKDAIDVDNISESIMGALKLQYNTAYRHAKGVAKDEMYRDFQLRAYRLMKEMYPIDTHEKVVKFLREAFDVGVLK
jgi:hypothetical protein